MHITRYDFGAAEGFQFWQVKSQLSRRFGARRILENELNPVDDGRLSSGIDNVGRRSYTGAAKGRAFSKPRSNVAFCRVF